MDGARVQKKSGGKPGPAVWVPAAILAVLLAAYLGLCGWVSASDTILPNVTAAGLDLSGMTQAEAEQAINENLSVAQQAGSGWAVGLSCDGYIGTLDGSSFQVDAASLAQASLSVGRGSFFTGGAQYLRHLFGAAQDLGADQVQLTEAGRTELERQLQAADSALGSGGSEDGYTADLEAGTLTLVKGHTHRSVDRQGAEEAVKSAYAQLLAQGQADTVQLPILDSAPQEPDFQAIHGELYAEAANAAIDPDTCEVLPHTVGVDFDTAQAQRLFQQAQEGETVEVPLTVTQPDITQEILADRLFADLLGQGIASLLSGVTNGYIIGFVFYVVGFLMTSLLYNRAVSTVLIPLVVITCSSIGCDPRGPIILVALSTMSSLVTPMATAVVPMAMNAGGYSAKTCLKVGLIPGVVRGIVGTLIAMTLYPM